MTVESLDHPKAASYKQTCWQECGGRQHCEALSSLDESQPLGCNPSKRDWVTLKRARAKAGENKDSLHK